MAFSFSHNIVSVSFKVVHHSSDSSLGAGFAGALGGAFGFTGSGALASVSISGSSVGMHHVCAQRYLKALDMAFIAALVCAVTSFTDYHRRDNITILTMEVIGNLQ